MNTNDENDVNTRIHVPWMHFNEWKEVYENVYSKKIKSQKRGYERLLVWKTRQTVLPAGVESTLELIHVHLLDQEVSQQISKGKRPTYADHDLQVMCTTAIMRFLNHISNVANTSKDTLYEMAAKLNIPNWLVDLRHSGAHGSDLPTLPVLRLGIKFAFDWLKENYWEETATVPGWIISKSNSSFNDKRIGVILDVWQALKMYEINGYKVIDEVPDENLRIFVTKLLNKTGETDYSLKGAALHLPHLIDRVQDKLFRVMKLHHARRGETVIEKLIAMLLQSESFIPPAHHITQEDEKGLTHESIVMWICKFWENFVIGLQERYAIFPSLVHKLLVLMHEERCKHRQLVMALWINQLCISMIKSQSLVSKVNIRRTEEAISGGIFDKTPQVTEWDIFNFVKKNPDLQNGFLAYVGDERANSCSLADIKLAVFSPNEFTPLFLPRLLKVVRPSIPDTPRNLLQEIVTIYAQTSDLGDDYLGKEEHTLVDLYKNLSQELPPNLKLLDAVPTVQSAWDFASQYDWATCPLGVLPWQKEAPGDLELPSHITWKLPDAAKENSNSFQSLVKTKVDWPAVMKGVSNDKKNIQKRKRARKIARKLARMQGKNKTHLQENVKKN